jgi:outer membrane murein-binding lipoprotein Lpp
MSPTRPPSVRKRQSLHIMDLETKLDNLVNENRLLQDAKARADQAMQDANTDREMHATTIRQATEAVASRDAQLKEKDELIAQIKATVEQLQQEIARLGQENAHLTEQNQGLAANAISNERFAQVQAENADHHHKWQTTALALTELQAAHQTMSSGMEQIVRDEIASALEDRNAEIERLTRELEAAMEQIKALQEQIVRANQGADFLTVRDEDYFDSACQQLCQHVQQWVLRFSKFSDNRACRLSSEIRDDKIEARLDDAILDGSDVDMLLADRVRRRDVFMSVVMSMIWEYVFTRYLFGMDREQRQKLKALEKTLTDVGKYRSNPLVLQHHSHPPGPQRAVAQWRAITLTLLSRREAFKAQREQDTEAVVQEIYSTLAKLLPPPSQLVRQIQESLRNVMRLAVNLSIEMRSQRAEYLMLPPLRPEYDTNGDLVQKVRFNAALMNERSGDTHLNEELEERQAVVKIVLFPLVVKKGDDVGEGEDEIVVCPAQVLVAKSRENKKVVRVLSGAMDIDERRSMTSVLPGSAIA